MRRLIMFLLFLVVSVWFGLTVVRHPGYMLLVYQPWMVQMPLWFALLGLLLIFGLFFIVIDSIDQVSFLWYRIKNWFRIRREQKFYSKTQQGLTYLIEARWKKSEKFLLAGANQSAEPLVNYLAAARAATELNAADRAEKYIQQAYQIAPNAKIAIGLTQAECQIQQEQLDKAMITLTRLRNLSPRHPRVLKMLEKVYVRLGRWEDLRLLLPLLRKARLITSDQAEQFEKNIYCEILRTSSAADMESFHAIWENVPRNMRKNPDVVYAYVLRLQRFGLATEEIETIIRKTLKTSWHPGLVRIYSNLPFNNLNKQLVIGAAWLKVHGEQQELLLMLGKLCTQIQLWGKAKDYFERCLAMGPNAEAAMDYGMLLEELDKPEEALSVYRESLQELTKVETSTKVSKIDLEY